MATGVSTKMKSSEETFDYTCSVCRKKNRVREAVKHCQDCHKDLCTSCLEHHRDYLEDHTLVEPSAAGRSVVMPTEKCRQHGERVVELWCKNHDEILCSTCVIMDHRSCEGVKFISGNIDDLLLDSELQETIKALKNIKEKLKTLKDDRGKAEEELLSEKNTYLNMVEEQKKKIISVVESLEKAAVGEINVWYNEREDKLREEQDKCDKLERESTTYIQELDPTLDNRSQKFVSMKKGQKVVAAFKELDGQREIQSDEEYEINPEIEKYLFSAKSFGSFKKINHLYKASGVRKINVKVATDRNKCYVIDTCFLSDSSILVAVCTNKKLKRLDSTAYTVTDQCDLPGKPWAVCCVGSQNVVVGLSDRNRVQFVSISNNMTLSRSIDVDHLCRGVGYSDGELFVSDRGKNVFVYNMAGTLLRTISQTPSGEAMFSLTRHISLLGDRVYVVDKECGLICTDKNGTDLCRYMGSQIKNGHGVCIDGHKGTFLCGTDSHNVVQVGADGEELGVVLTKANGLNYPTSVCFDPSCQTLIVTNIHSDEILLFNLV